MLQIKFDKLEAAILYARALAIETGFDYGVFSNRTNDKYCAIPLKDFSLAERNGWIMEIGPNVLRTSESTNIPSHKF